METTKLTSVNAVNKALDAELEITAVQMRAMKPQERRLRAARLSDLYGHRAWLFNEALGRMAEFVPSAELDLVATALSRAIDKDRDSARFWNNEAGSR